MIVCSYSLPKNGVYYFFSFARRTRKENCSAQVHDLQKNENAAEIALKQLSEPVSLVRFFVHSHLMSRVPKTDLCRKNHRGDPTKPGKFSPPHHWFLTSFKLQKFFTNRTQITERKSHHFSRAPPQLAQLFNPKSHKFKKTSTNNSKHQQTIDIPHHDSFLSP